MNTQQPSWASPARPPLTARQNRGGVLAGLAVGIFMALLFADGWYLIVVVAAGPDWEVWSPVAAAVAVIVFVAAGLAGFLILIGHGVRRPLAVVACGIAITVVASSLIVTIVVAGAFVVGVLSLITTFADELLDPVMIGVLVLVALCIVPAALLAFTSMTRAFREPAPAHPWSPTPPTPPAQPPAPPAVRI